MKTKLAILSLLIASTVVPVQQSQAALSIALVVPTRGISLVGLSAGAAVVIGAMRLADPTMFSDISRALAIGFVAGGSVLLDADTNVNYEGVVQALNSLYPDIENQDVVAQMADQVRALYPAVRNADGSAEIKVPVEVTTSILAQTALSDARIAAIAQEIAK